MLIIIDNLFFVDIYLPVSFVLVDDDLATTSVDTIESSPLIGSRGDGVAIADNESTDDDAAN